MPIDFDVALSEGWWLNRLLTKLDGQRARYDILESYFLNTASVPVRANKAVSKAYQRLMSMAKTNLAELIAEAVRERMNPAGFRTGAQGDDLSDAEANRIWQANSLDADSMLVHRAQLVMSRAYVIVGGVDPSIDAPLITPEDPREVVTEQDPVKKRRTIAALKVFRDDTTGLDWAYLYLPGVVHKAARPSKKLETAVELDMANWEWISSERLPDAAKNEVPVVSFVNRPNMAGEGLGEFETNLALLNRINYTILSRLEIITLQAFKQRAVKGVPPKDPATGESINYDDIFAADPGALWILPATAEIWESGQVDLTPIHTAIRDDVQDLAAATRTPLFYLTPDAANGSAEGASLAREGLVFKTTDRLGNTGESWEQVMYLAFLLSGDTERAKRRDMEIIWASPERFSLAEKYDAAVKAQAAGVPWRTVMSQILQFSPQEIERMSGERQEEALLAPPQVNA